MPRSRRRVIKSVRGVWKCSSGTGNFSARPEQSTCSSTCGGCPAPQACAPPCQTSVAEFLGVIDTQVYRPICCCPCERRATRHNQAGSGLQKKGNPMSYRIANACLTAAIVGIACMSTEADARRGGGAGVRAGGVHAGGVRAGGAYRGTAYRGAYRGAYVRRGVGAAAVGAAAVGAATYGARCGYYPYPPCY